MPIFPPPFFKKKEVFKLMSFLGYTLASALTLRGSSSHTESVAINMAFPIGPLSLPLLKFKCRPYPQQTFVNQKAPRGREKTDWKTNQSRSDRYYSSPAPGAGFHYSKPTVCLRHFPTRTI